MRIHSIIILTALLNFFLPHAWAQTVDAMKFTIGNKCVGAGAQCLPRIYAEGQIRPDSARQLAQLLRTKRSQLPERVIVSLDSPGGDLFGGIQLGREIRKQGLDTELVFGQTCVSACSLAFLGGLSRIAMDSDVRYGVHQFYSTGGNIGDGLTQVTVVMLAAYIEEMGVNRKLLDIASLTSPTKMEWLSDEQREELRVTNVRHMYSDWKLDVGRDGSTFAVADVLYPGDIMKGEFMIRKVAGGGVELAVRLIPSGHSRKRVISLVNVDNFKIEVDGHVVLSNFRPIWQKQADSIGFSVPLDKKVLAELGKNREVRFDFGVPFSVRELDPSITLPSQSLARYVPIIKR